MRTPHTSCRKGTTVRIKLRSGEIIIDKFVDRTAKFIILERYGKLKPIEISTFSVNKLKEKS